MFLLAAYNLPTKLYSKGIYFLELTHHRGYDIIHCFNKNNTLRCH